MTTTSSHYPLCFFMKILRCEFYIVIELLGTQTPMIKVEPQEFRWLSNIGIVQMGRSQTVRLELEKIQKVLDGEEVEYFFAYQEPLYINFCKQDSNVHDGMGMFEPFIMPTIEIVTLLNDWLAFLLAYENGEIPGIIYRPNTTYRND
jgi:hypothetical protein